MEGKQTDLARKFEEANKANVELGKRIAKAQSDWKVLVKT